MKIDSLVQFKLNPNKEGLKIMVVGLEERAYVKFRTKMRIIKQNYQDTKGHVSQDLIQEFENLYNVSPFNIIVHGNNNMSEDLARNLIPKLENNNYKCFDIIDRTKGKYKTKDSILGHATATEAWNCFINLIGRPKFIIIYKDKRDIYDEINR